MSATDTAKQGGRQARQQRRLFFALWPDPEIHRLLVQASRTYSSRPVREANLHLTLVFLGNRNSDELACFRQAAASVQAPAFVLELNYLGAWSRSGILWLGSSEIPDALLHTYKELQQALLPCGVTPEKRRFVPHITLSRHAKKPKFKGVVDAIGWSVREFVLVESIAQADGVHYEVLERWPLQGTD